jgi:hypothetical protein
MGGGFCVLVMMTRHSIDTSRRRMEEAMCGYSVVVLYCISSIGGGGTGEGGKGEI